MFFTLGTDLPKVERALLDGSERISLVNKIKLVQPQALTLDPVNKHVYWSDSYLDRIERIDYSGDKASRTLIAIGRHVSYFIIVKYQGQITM